jgi:DNA polymerase III epsilon subunit-like protein
VVPVGDSFVARLGPAADERFAAIDDPEEETLLPRPAPATPIGDLRFVAVDCETTGQSPHRLVELGAVAFNLGGHLMSFETLVHSNDRINPFARRIHGISSETLGGAPPVRPVLERFRRFCRGAVLVEHSADAFDTRLIATTLGESLDADNLDTSKLAAKLFDLRDTIGLERLCQELAVPHRRPHHALADAEATMGCFLELIRRGREPFGWRTLADLLADGQPPPPRWVDAEAGSARDEQRRRRGGRRHRRSGSAGDAGTP